MIEKVEDIPMFFANFAHMTRYRTAELSNGLRIIALSTPAQVVYCGYQIRVGSANEPAGDEGIAHFCEHVTFKGTQKRTAIEVINGLEQVGGDLNAFTTKTDTVYYSAILKQHFERATDLLTDIVFHSVYPEKEVKKEVEVICDEIESYKDSPAELIYDDFEDLLFHGHPLGHNILGRTNRVRTFNAEDAKGFTKKFYQPQNAIFFAYGDFDFFSLLSWLCTVHKTEVAHIDNVEKPQPSVLPDVNEYQPQTVRIKKNTHQAHVMIGNRAYSVHDKRRIALYLLNNILGGPAMSARLNLALREQRGLVYTVESTLVSYPTTGVWSIYLGCDPTDVEECLNLIRAELDKFMSSKLSSDDLAVAKQQIKGQIGIASDSRESMALDFGKGFLHYGWQKNIEALYRDIDAISAEEIQAVANDIFPQERLTTLIYE